MLESSICFSMRHWNLKNYKVTNHFHECYELVYYIRGSGISNIANQEFRYTDFCFCIIPPNKIHSEHTETETDLMYIGFEYDDSLGVLPVTFINEIGDIRIYNVMNKILQEMNTREANYSIMLTLCLNELIVEVLRIIHAQSIDSQNSIIHIDYVKNFIKSNYSKNINPQELAAAMGYSYHYFRNLFKKTYGITIKQYVLNVRIKAAKELLRQTSQPINKIALQCGFCSPSRFIAIFKQRTGETPHVFRTKYVRFTEKANYLDGNKE